MTTHEGHPQDEVNSFGIVIGHSLARTITDQLGTRLQFPDPSGELEQLLVSTDELRALEVSEPELARVLEAEQVAVSIQAQETRLDRYDRMLLRDRVIIRSSRSQDTEDYTWQDIPPGSRAKFAHGLDDIRASLVIKQPEESPEDPELTEAMQLEVVSLLGGGVLPLLKELQASIPIPEDPKREGKVARYIAKLVRRRARDPEVEYQDSGEENLGSKDLARISRKARKLNQIVRDLIKDPHGFLADLIIQEQKEGIEQQATELLDARVASVNHSLISAATIGQRAVSRTRNVIKETGRSLSQGKLIPVVAAVSAEVRPPFQKETLETAGIFKLSMPWMPGGKTIAEVQRLTRDGQTVYIARGMPPKLRTIASRSRQKTPLTAEGLNQYDEIAIHMARLIALGHMPYQSSNPVKMVRSRQMRKEYENIGIWYPPNTSPNTPRLYFTLKKMGELTDITILKSQGINPDKLCLVVLAETDKANQTEVLEQFTGRSKRDLRVRGSGS